MNDTQIHAVFHTAYAYFRWERDQEMKTGGKGMKKAIKMSCAYVRTPQEQGNHHTL